VADAAFLLEKRLAGGRIAGGLRGRHPKKNRPHTQEAA
jgi:hypothetical protein